MEEIKTWCSNRLMKMSEETKAYSAAFFLSGIAFFLFELSLKLLAEILFFLAASLMVYGVSIFLVPKVKLVWSSLIGKGLISIAVFVGTTLSFALANQVINYSLGVTSGPFLYTHSLVSLLISPFLLLASLIIALVIMMLMSIPMMVVEGFRVTAINMFIGPGKNKTDVTFLWLMRFIALMVSVILCTFLLEHIDRYGDVITEFTRWFAFHMETDIHTHCDVGPGVRVAYVSSDMIITAVKSVEGYLFEVSACEFKM